MSQAAFFVLAEDISRNPDYCTALANNPTEFDLEVDRIEAGVNSTEFANDSVKVSSTDPPLAAASKKIKSTANTVQADLLFPPRKRCRFQAKPAVSDVTMVSNQQLTLVSDEIIPRLPGNIGRQTSSRDSCLKFLVWR